MIDDADVFEAKRLLGIVYGYVNSCHNGGVPPDEKVQDVTKEATVLAIELMDKMLDDNKRLRNLLAKTHQYRIEGRSGAKEMPGCSCGWSVATASYYEQTAALAVFRRHVEYVMDAP